MSIRILPGSGLNYYLVCVDGAGAERSDDPDAFNGRMSPRVSDVLAREPYTDVFLMSHGWMGDGLAAQLAYWRQNGRFPDEPKKRKPRPKGGGRGFLAHAHGETGNPNKERPRPDFLTDFDSNTAWPVQSR